jgi:hypothetical protein
LQVTKVAATEIVNADDSEIRPKATHELMSLQAGVQHIGHTLTYHKNYLRDKHKKTLIHGETISILRYFCQQAIGNPSFQHAEQIDDNKRLVIFFGLMHRW